MIIINIICHVVNVLQQSETVLGTVPLHISQTLEELRLLQAYRHDNILQVRPTGKKKR